ncbi:MAG UNVERIFIED_CONTAM: UTP--glucose-1-phosphate uridylyltransferase [Planctomycetaceae bacterium]|jgi:UDP-N-acetylglucosamine/UDP-N-acetylgalactosamine diphosphorylase
MNISSDKPATSLEQQLQELGQGRLLGLLRDPLYPHRQRLLDQLQSIDLSLLHEVRLQKTSPAVGLDRVAFAKAPSQVVRQPKTPADQLQWESAQTRRCCTASGGTCRCHHRRREARGRDFGFEQPKGMYPIGPVSQRTLFQIFAEQILARRRRHAAELPWLIMTSDATHAETVAFFQSRAFFGLPENQVHFFRQGSLPALDAATGEILLSGPDEIALSPDGHGGIMGHCSVPDCLTGWNAAGLNSFTTIRSTTPLPSSPTRLCWDFTAEPARRPPPVWCPEPARLSAMGVVVEVSGRAEIIEYSELTPEQSAGVDESGQWIFWAGNTAIHVFERAFLQQLSSAGSRLPLHAARKNVPHIDAQGKLRQPTDPACPNAIKLEQFIFDALPMASRTLVVEGDRNREFNPVKNSTGTDSVETCRMALRRIAAAWLAEVGYVLPDDTAIEISPLEALDAEELRQRVVDGTLSVETLIQAHAGEVSANVLP